MEVGTKNNFYNYFINRGTHMRLRKFFTTRESDLIMQPFHRKITTMHLRLLKC